MVVRRSEVGPHPAARCGRVWLLVLLGLGLVSGLAVAGLGWRSQAVEAELAGLLAKGYEATQADKLAEAVAAFDRAAGVGWGVLGWSRTLGFGGGVDRDEVRQLQISVRLVQAYTAMFLMKPAAEPLSEAQKLVGSLAGAGRDELVKDVATAVLAEKARARIVAGQVREGLRAALEAEKQAREGDLDFFIQETRLLIAAGKKTRDEGILTRARELVWLLSSTNDKNPRIKQLWGVLARP